VIDELARVKHLKVGRAIQALDQHWHPLRPLSAGRCQAVRVLFKKTRARQAVRFLIIKQVVPWPLEEACLPVDGFQPGPRIVSALVALQVV
jgi:hypothetical protein